jgi:hypothetical protein
MILRASEVSDARAFLFPRAQMRGIDPIAPVVRCAPIPVIHLGLANGSKRPFAVVQNRAYERAESARKRLRLKASAAPIAAVGNMTASEEAPPGDNLCRRAPALAGGLFRSLAQERHAPKTNSPSFSGLYVHSSTECVRRRPVWVCLARTVQSGPRPASETGEFR